MNPTVLTQAEILDAIAEFARNRTWAQDEQPRRVELTRDDSGNLMAIVTVMDENPA